MAVRLMAGGHERPGCAAHTEVAGYIDGRPVPRAEVDRRLAAMRAGPRSGALPAPGSAEGRQLRRWVAQVILTEELCQAVASERGLALPPDTPARIGQRAAVEFGSITAAAFEGSPAVRAVYAAVTAQVPVAADEVARYREGTAVPRTEPVWRVSVNGDEFDAAPGTLPARLAAALRSAPPGQAVTVGGWTAQLIRVLPPASGDSGTEEAGRLVAASRRLAFTRWLEQQRAARVRQVPGFEHPGDPRQPDNHHRH